MVMVGGSNSHCLEASVARDIGAGDVVQQMFPEFSLVHFSPVAQVFEEERALMFSS
jgi:hypothetical protein